MKRMIIAALISATLFILPASALASDIPDIAAELPYETQSALSGVDILTGTGGEKAIGRIIDGAKEKFSDTVGESLRRGASVLLIAIICALADTVTDEGGKIDAVSLAAVAAVGAAAISGVSSLMEIAVETIDDLEAFTHTLLPVLSSASAASGAVSSSAAKYAAVLLFVNIAASVGKTLVVPLVGAYLAASAGAASFGGGLDAAAKLIKRIIIAVLTVIATAFTIYLTVSGTVSSATDAAAVKVTKAAVSGMLPVVGGIISDASEAVVSGASMLKNGVSIFGMLAVCALCAAPFLRLAVNALIFKAAGALSTVLVRRKIADFIDAVATAVTLLLALAGTMAVMLFFSIVSFMQTVVT